ncbi:hypothetical protein ACVIG9_001745 [Bradyrhizobium ottawaense]
MACIRDERKATRERHATKAPACSRSNMPQPLLTHCRAGCKWNRCPCRPEIQDYEPAPASDHPGARDHADPGLGVQLLSAGADRRSHGARPRRLLQLDLWRVLGLAGDLGDARPAHRASDRSCRRPAGAVGFEPDDCRRPRAAWLRAFRPGDGDRLARARNRNGDGALRRRLRRPGAHLRHRGAQAHHGYHADGGLRLHRRRGRSRPGACRISAGARPALPGRPPTS